MDSRKKSIQRLGKIILTARCRMRCRIRRVARETNVPEQVVVAIEKAKISPDRLLEHWRQILRLIGFLGLQSAERQKVFSLVHEFPAPRKFEREVVEAEADVEVPRQPRKMPSKRPNRSY